MAPVTPPELRHQALAVDDVSEDEASPGAGEMEDFRWRVGERWGGSGGDLSDL